MSAHGAAIEAVRAELLRLHRYRKAAQKAAATASEVRNSISSIALNAELLLDEEASDDVRRLCRAIHGESGRLADLVLEPSRPSWEQLEPEDAERIDALCAALRRPTLLERLRRWWR